MRFFHRLVALLLSLAYTSTGTSMLPGVVMTAAWADGSHEVRIVQSEHGMQVRLHHGDEENFTPEVADHPSAFTRVLVRMCAPAREGDHNLSTQCVSGSALVSREDAMRATKPPPAVNLTATIELLAQLPDPRHAHRLHPRLGTRVALPQGHHACVATVRLLI